jgi:O-antigen/teichoic acid export membrane protein
MTISGEYRIRQIVLVGASVFLVSAMSLIAFPQQFGDFINISGADAVWALRMIGVVLLPLSYAMFILRATASNHTIKSFATLMVLVSAGLAVVTWMAPGEANIGRYLYAFIGAAFSLAYATAIIIRPRGR